MNKLEFGEPDRGSVCNLQSTVTPAKAGVPLSLAVEFVASWFPACAGMTVEGE